MIQWLARRRFNHIDNVSAVALGVGLAAENYWLVFAILLVAPTLSVVVERIALGKAPALAENE